MNSNEAFSKAKSIDNKTDLVIFLDYLSNKTGNPDLYEDIFDYFINNQNPDVKCVCVEALLTNMDRADEKYLKIAIQCIKNPINIDDEFDLRLQCITSLGDVYFCKKDKSIVKLFYDHYKYCNEEDAIVTNCFEAILKVMFGMNTYDIAKKNGGTIFDIDDINLSAFKDEIQQIEEFLSPASSDI